MECLDKIFLVINGKIIYKSHNETIFSSFIIILNKKLWIENLILIVVPETGRDYPNNKCYKRLFWHVADRYSVLTFNFFIGYFF